MRTVTALLTNKAYGYPTRGAKRRRKPTILACLHQTANAKATAMQERNYANRTGSWGPSATAYIDHDGTVIRAIDPAKYAAWSQGDVARPNTKIPTMSRPLPVLLLPGSSRCHAGWSCRGSWSDHGGPSIASSTIWPGAAWERAAIARPAVGRIAARRRSSPYIAGNVSDTTIVAPPPRTGQPWLDLTAASRLSALMIE